jgi:hypothetical protein
VRIGLEILAVLVLGFMIYQFIGPGQITAVATAPPIDPNIPVGRLRFDDFNCCVDSVSLTMNNNVPQPEAGTHYEAWLVGNDGGTARDLGTIAYGPSGIARLDFNDPREENLLKNFNQVQITREPDNVVSASPTGEVVYSSIFPPAALEYIRYIIVAYEKTPDQGPLMQNLWYYSGDYINKSINGDVLEKDYLGIRQAFEANDEETLRKRTEEVINQIVGDASDEYQDFDGDGQIDNPGDGYGSLASGPERLGYLQETTLNAKLAADAPDSTPNIRL